MATTVPIAASAARRPRSAVLRLGRRSLLTALMIVGGVVWTIPSLWALSTSLKLTENILTVPPVWIPYPASLEQYASLFSDQNTVSMGRAFLNSTVVSVITTVLVIVVSALAAYPLARMRFRGRDLIFALIVGSLMVPGVISIAPLYLLMYYLGWISTYQALIVPQLASAFGVFLLHQFFLSMPRELEDAAYIDGAGSADILVRILLPLSQPAIATLAIFTFLWTWNDFTWPLIVLNQQSMFTLPIALSLLKTAYSGYSFGPIMAGTVVTALPLLLVFLVANRHIIEGVQLAGLKT